MRPSHNLFMKWALDLAEHSSTCSKIKVGAILVKDTRVVSLGYNGVSSGREHCVSVFDEEDRKSPDFLKRHAIFSEENEFHAEHNAIIDALLRGQDTRGCDLYTTHSPCFGCCKLIISSGISRVFYKEPYKLETLEFLHKNNVFTFNIDEVIE